MSRKSLFLTLGLAFGLLVGIATTLLLLIRHEPATYRRTSIPPGPQRKERSEEVKEELSQLTSALLPGNEREWAFDLTDEQINSYFAEDFKQSNADEHLLPEGISEPRVVFESGKVKLAFRYGKGLLSSIVSLDFNVWLTREPNVVCLQLLGLQAGSLPIGAQLLLDSLTELCENNNIGIEWYRHDGHPVALLRFQTSQSETPMQLQVVQVDEGRIVIRGKPVDPNPGRTTAAATEPQPLGGE